MRNLKLNWTTKNGESRKIEGKQRRQSAALRFPPSFSDIDELTLKPRALILDHSMSHPEISLAS